MEEGRGDMEKLEQHPPPRRGSANNHHPPPPPRKCPRCDSSNTKFCYYNNYSLSQPRYFCKSCRRYWTHGGTLRNVPVGGGCRKGKRPRPSVSSSSRSEIARTRSLSPVIPAGSSSRALPSMASSFYIGGGYLSSLTAAQSIPARTNPSSIVAGNSHYGANMNLLHGINASSMMAPLPPPPPPHQFQVPNEFFAPQPNLNDNPLTGYLTQSFIDRGSAASSSTASHGFWSGGGAATGGDSKTGSSFNPNRWSDHSLPGFPPSQ